MAARSTAQARRGHGTQDRSRRHESTTMVPTQVVCFDGRDVNDDATALAVRASAVGICSHCGTVRDARFAFCCELVAVWAESAPPPASRRPAPPPAPALQAVASSAA